MLGNKPTVSVLMTAFNRENFIAEAIESVLKSSFKDLELIIVDDNSADRSAEIAKRFQSLDDRVRVVVNERNLGDYKNRNKAASFARGKYLKYLDSDDLIYPHSLEIMVNAMEMFPSAAYGFSYIQKKANVPPYPRLISSRSAYLEHFFEGGLFYAGPGGAIIRRDCFEKVGGFTGKRYVGDTELWMYLSMQHDCVVFQSDLIWWRVHACQESVFERKNADTAIVRFNNDLYFLSHDQCPLNTYERSKAKGNLYRIIWRKIIKDVFFKLDLSLLRGINPPFKQLFLSVIPINRLKNKLTPVVKAIKYRKPVGG